MVTVTIQNLLLFAATHLAITGLLEPENRILCWSFAVRTLFLLYAEDEITLAFGEYRLLTGLFKLLKKLLFLVMTIVIMCLYFDYDFSGIDVTESMYDIWFIACLLLAVKMFQCYVRAVDLIKMFIGSH
jgi:hypothetical protein